MRKVILDQPQRVGQWVTEQQGKVWSSMAGAAIGVEENGQLIAGVIYESRTRASLHAHIAALLGRTWPTREYLKLGFGYPFIQLGCSKIIAMVGEKNLAVQRLQKHMGYKLEATLVSFHEAAAPVIYTLAREDCRWIL